METKLEAKIYNQDGQETGKMELPKSIFGVKWNNNLVQQVITSMLSNERPNVADAKGRGEVAGGGKKPWQQKGTGRARHGSSRSPIWKGGGVTHGPTSERNYKKKINKKVKSKALYSVLSAKLKDGEIVLLDDLKLDSPKAKSAESILNNLAASGFAKLNYQKGKRALVAVSMIDEKIKRSFQNIKSATVEEVRNLNPLSLLNYKYLVLVKPTEGLKILEQRAK
ncbi:MAG: 50S ribosomal protein L4 [Patescibacteria group bacterium]